MSNITLEELQNVVPFENKVKERCLEVMKWIYANDDDCYYVLPDNNKAYGNSMYIDIGDTEVEITVTELWAYSGREDHYYTIPFEWIVNDDWHEEYLKQAEEKRLAAEQWRKAEEERNQKELELHERAEYERSKNKYGNL